MFGLTKKEPTDEEAMVRFQNGDTKAFDLLLHRHSAGVLGFIMKMIGGRGTFQRSIHAEDLLQEVFIKVIEHRKKYNSKQKFSTWLYALARNRCIDYLRIEKYRYHISLDAPYPIIGESDGPVILEIIRDSEKNQEEDVMDKEMQVLLDKSIEDLKEEYREVFLLREIKGLSFKEIAGITQVPLSTVKSRLRYAYQNLREVFIKAGYFEKKQRAKGV